VKGVLELEKFWPRPSFKKPTTFDKNVGTTDFYRAMRMHSADYAVVRCVCPSIDDCVKTAKRVINFFSPSGIATPLFFPRQTL